jgi:hypothetical protein
VITGELKSKVDRVWGAFWSGGIANPLEVIEQITYLLFLRRLDELQTLAENKANRTGKPLERVIFDGGAPDPRRWKNFKQADPASMFATVSDHVFPWLRTLGGEGSTYSTHMKDARFTIPTPATVDAAHLIVTRPAMTRESLYVGITRGRHANHAYIATDFTPDAEPTTAPTTFGPLRRSSQPSWIASMPTSSPTKPSERSWPGLFRTAKTPAATTRRSHRMVSGRSFAARFSARWPPRRQHWLRP